MVGMLDNNPTLVYGVKSYLFMARHGLGVLLQRERVVDLGGADVSFAWAPNEADKL